MSGREARAGRRCEPCRQSLCGPSCRPPGNRADLLASGSPHAVPALPESLNVITGLLVVSGSPKLRCTCSGGSGSMNVGSLLSEEVPVPDGLQRGRLRALPTSKHTPTHTHATTQTAHLITLPPSEPCNRRTDRSVSMSPLSCRNREFLTEAAALDEARLPSLTRLKPTPPSRFLPLPEKKSDFLNHGDLCFCGV